MAANGDGKVYSCTLCEHRNPDLFDFMDHMVTHSKIYPHGCDHCTARYSHVNTLHHHKQQAHGIYYSMADVPVAVHRPEPVRSSSQWQIFACPSCDYKGSRIDSFKKHATEHTGLYRYNCCICSLPFHYSFQLIRHFMRQHGQQKAEYEESVEKSENLIWFKETAKLYKSVSNFKFEATPVKPLKNEKAHTMQTYICEVCGVQFASKLRYTSHVFDNHKSNENTSNKAAPAKNGIDLNFDTERDVKPSELQIEQVYSASEEKGVDSWPFENSLLDFSK
ncbi:zinc finger protein 710-like [Watersipora subatra]|uniref:zinc finger protein 710-like n=1 Tax=Watersipora subatra TaxID=2589382 RepID=UPI00355B974F